MTDFLPTLLKQAGIVSGDRQRVLNLANSITSMTGALTGTAVVDHVGRRPLLLFSSCSCCIGMAIVAGLLSNITDNIHRTNAGISFICEWHHWKWLTVVLFMVFFSFGWTPLQALYPAEILPFQNRAKGLALQGWATSAVSCINTFGLPSALASLQWKSESTRGARLTSSLLDFHGLGRSRYRDNLLFHRRDQTTLARRARRCVRRSKPKAQGQRLVQAGQGKNPCREDRADVRGRTQRVDTFSLFPFWLSGPNLECMPLSEAPQLVHGAQRGMSIPRYKGAPGVPMPFPPLIMFEFGSKNDWKHVTPFLWYCILTYVGGSGSNCCSYSAGIAWEI